MLYFCDISEVVLMSCEKHSPANKRPGVRCFAATKKTFVIYVVCKQRGLKKIKKDRE